MSLSPSDVAQSPSSSTERITNVHREFAAAIGISPYAKYVPLQTTLYVDFDLAPGNPFFRPVAGRSHSIIVSWAGFESGPIRLTASTSKASASLGRLSPEVLRSLKDYSVLNSISYRPV